MSQELFDAYLRGELDTARDGEMKRLLGDPAQRARFVAALQEHALLADLSRQLAAAPTTARRRRRRSPRRLPLLLPLAAAAAVAAVIAAPFALRARPAAPPAVNAPPSVAMTSPTITGESGTTTVDGRPATASQPLTDDARIVASGVARVDFADGTWLRLAAGEATVAGQGDQAKRIALRRGRIEARVAHQPEGRPLRIATADAEATVVGTRFALAADASGTRLAVDDGRVRLRRGDGAELTVAADQCAATDATTFATLPGPEPEPRYRAWKHGPSADPAWFPIGVWLQNPDQAERYRAAGFTCYVGLWEGPTEEQLATLKRARMPVFCEQNAVALAHRADPAIIGWLLDDEPDNAQERAHGDGYDPPITPERIAERFRAAVAADPDRPVLLNLGQGVAWDGWYGRGERTNHPEDYPRYIAACDIAAFDIYPAATEVEAASGKLWLVADGMRRLRAWTPPAKPTWNVLECGRIKGPGKPTPAQVEAEAWMSLIHGSTGLVWFVHTWTPEFDEHALLDDPTMLAAVSALNHRILALAPVLNRPSVADGVAVSAPDSAPVAAMLKRLGDEWWLLAVALRGEAGRATFRLRGLPAGLHAIGDGDARPIPIADGAFADDFGPWATRVYRITRK